MRRVTHTALVLVLLSLGSFSAGVAQEATAPVEPQFEGVFMCLDSTTGALLNLERELPRLRQSKGLLPGAKVEFEIADEQSAVRIPTDPLPVFVVRVPERTGDPHQLLQFFRMKVDGSKRVMRIGTVSAWDGAITTGYDEESLVSFEVGLYGSASYSFSPSEPLEPGEYCVGLSTSEYGFCFGIDAPKQR